MSNPWTVSRAASAATAAEDKDSVAKKKPNLMEIMDEQLALNHMQQFEADITYGERDNAAGGSLSPSSYPAAPVAAILECENTVSIAGDPASDVITKNEQMELDESLLLAMVLQQIEEEEQAEAVAQSHASSLPTLHEIQRRMLL